MSMLVSNYLHKIDLIYVGGQFNNVGVDIMNTLQVKVLKHSAAQKLACTCKFLPSVYLIPNFMFNLFCLAIRLFSLIESQT